MSKTWTTALIGTLSILVASCGPLQQGNRSVEVVTTVFGALAGGGESEAVDGTPLTREVIEAQEIDLLRVSIISREATAFLAIGGVNGTTVTWLSPDGLSLTFDRGVLVASRGFGDDLMGSDAGGAIASLNGGGNHLRTQDFLNSLDRIEQRVFQCETIATGTEALTIVERTYQTTVLEETCVDGGFSFKNTYWRDREGVIWQSRQWISAQTGYLGYQRL